MASSDEEKSESEKHISAEPPLQKQPASASTGAVKAKRSRPKKWGSLDITSEDAFKPAPSKNACKMASLVEAKLKLKAEVRKAAALEKATARKQARLKQKAQNLSNDELCEIIQQRRQVVNKAEKRAKAAQESKAEEPVKKQAKKAKNEEK